MDGSPFRNAEFGDASFADGQIRLSRDPTKAVAITEVMRHGKLPRLEAETDSKATFEAQSAKQKDYARNTHSAVFVEVKVDEDLGTIHVTRVVSAVAAARILNPKTARSQILGAVVGGIGMALHEESVLDQNFGRFMNHSFGEYHIPVNADIHDIEVIFVEEHDEIVNPIGVKGVGEIGICGVAAAVANAVFHATGKRVRGLPITLDKLL
jgi:xanthine dehydrogenase YagR molybdenum-binding subunit